MICPGQFRLEVVEERAGGLPSLGPRGPCTHMGGRQN